MLNIRKKLAYMLVCALIVCGIGGCGSDKQATTVMKHTIVDMAGRQVDIPDQIEKIYSVNPLGTTFLYTLAPDKLTGWNYALTPNEKKYINPKYHDLPVLGSYFSNKGSASSEEILRIKPDIIVKMSSVNEAEISSADSLQEQSSIPVIIIDGDITNLDQTYEFMGEIVGEKETAQEMADYCKNIYEPVREKVPHIPQDQIKNVYYAEGPEGLETDPKGSLHTQIIDFVGGNNVAELPTTGVFGRSLVSMEQVALWDPDLIIVGFDPDSDNSFYDNIFSNPNWKDLKAVKNRDIYAIPQYPFNWFDRPPSVNRVIGVKWMANLLYPDIYDYDITEETKAFYKLFYHCDLTDEEASTLLKQSIRIQ